MPTEWITGHRLCEAVVFNGSWQTVQLKESSVSLVLRAADSK